MEENFQGKKINRNKVACGIHAASSSTPREGPWGIRKKRNEAACGNPHHLVVHTVGMSHGKEVGIGGTIRAPSLLVVAESLGKRPCHPLEHPRCPPAHPSLLTAAPIPLSLPSYTSFDSVTWRRWGCQEPVTWRCWGASLGSLGAGDVALVGGRQAGVRRCREGVTWRCLWLF